MARLAQLASLDGPFRAFRSPGPWLWTAAFIGAVLRIYLVFFTEGTADVPIWESHAEQVHSKGLVSYYHGGRHQFNHPPLTGIVFSTCREIAIATGIPFKVFLRLPFAILDAGTAWLFVVLLRGSIYRYLIAALYWLHPLALIYSAFHGNTDSAVAFSVMGAIVLVTRNRPALAGAMIGLGLWVKLPCLLAIPALLAALPDWRSRFHFSLVCGGVGISSYLPVLIIDAPVLMKAVIFYSGLRIQTMSGGQVWGIQNFYPEIRDLPQMLRLPFYDFTQFYTRNNTLIGIVPLLVSAFCRRGERDPVGVARNVGRSYIILMGLTNFWAFQYFAWSLPLWLLMGWRFALASSLVASAYIYGLYAWLCDSFILQGSWDFVNKPDWPFAVLASRDVATLFFFISAGAIIARALALQWREIRRTREAPES